jgi:perosamine synthetase
MIPLSNPDITEQEIAEVVAVLRSGRLSLGAKLDEFEESIAKYVGAKYAIAVNSGTSGLHLCVKALGIGAGDEVLVPTFTFISAANVVLQERAVPVFVDVDENSLNISTEKIESKITSKTKAIMVVHTFGRAAEMDEIRRIAEKYDLKIIEDACEALGAEFRGEKVGKLGDAGVFAFYPNKQITTGEGGMVVTNNESTAKRIKSLRNQGRAENGEWFEHLEPGFNYRLDEMSCALGSAQMRRISEIVARREEIARIYSEKLKDNENIILPELFDKHGKISWFVFVVRLAENFSRFQRDFVFKEMKKCGIGCGRYFAPIHLQKFYRENFDYKIGDFPVAEKVAERTIALPFFNRIMPEQIDEVCGNLVKLTEIC